MTKDEFLNKLEEALTDSVPPAVVRENIQYYGEYIDDEEKKGRSEEEVLDELGNPRLIAHTIIDTTPEVYNGQGDQGGSYYGSSASGRGSSRDSGRSTYHSFNLDLGKWYWKLIAFIVIFAIVMVIITVISGVMTLLMPVLPIILVVGMMMMLFGGHGR